MMLDQDDGDADCYQLPDQGLEVLDLSMGEAGGRLVQQQQLWAQRKRAGDFEAALMAEREIARLLVDILGESDEFEQLPRLFQELAFFATKTRQPEQRFKDVPLPIGLDEDLERSFIFESPKLQVGRMVYTSRDTIGELTQFFIQECPTAQWELGNVIEAQGAKKLFFTKPGKRMEVLVEGGSFGKGRRVVITLTPEVEAGATL